LSDKLFPVLKAEKGEQGGDHGSQNEIKPVVECGLGPEHRLEGLHAAEGIVEEEPGAVLDLIPQHPEKHEKDDQNYGRDIAAGGLGGDEKGQAPEEDHRDHDLRNHAPDGEVGQGDPAEEHQDEHQGGDDEVERHQPRQPDLVAVIGDAEECFHHACVHVPLDAVHRRIEDQQNTGCEEIVVQPLRIGSPSPSQQAEHKDQEKEAHGQGQED